MTFGRMTGPAMPLVKPLQEFRLFIASALCVLFAAAIPLAFSLFGLRGRR